MIGNVPLVGSLTTGFGDATTMAPTVKTPNLEEASQDFVSMLYSYMFQQMRESGSDEENGLFSGPHVNMLMGFMDQEIGKKLAASEGKGLATSLFQQLGGAEQALQAGPGAADANEANQSAQIEKLTEAGNVIRELTEKDPEMIDNSQQIMDQLYKLNQQK